MADTKDKRAPTKHQPRPSRASARVTSGVADGADAKPARPVEHALLAAERAVEGNSVHVNLPLVGRLQLPAADELVFVGGVTVLALVGILDWPVAVILGVGHALAGSRRNKVVRAFGEALSDV